MCRRCFLDFFFFLAWVPADISKPSASPTVLRFRDGTTIVAPGLCRRPCGRGGRELVVPPAFAHLLRGKRSAAIYEACLKVTPHTNPSTICLPLTDEQKLVSRTSPIQGSLLSCQNRPFGRLGLRTTHRSTHIFFLLFSVASFPAVTSDAAAGWEVRCWRHGARPHQPRAVPGSLQGE